MLDDTLVYAAAIVLLPGQGWRYLEEMWTTDKQKQWLESAKTAVETLWNDDYKTNIDLLLNMNGSPKPDAYVFAIANEYRRKPSYFLRDKRSFQINFARCKKM